MKMQLQRSLEYARWLNEVDDELISRYGLGRGQTPLRHQDWVRMWEGKITPGAAAEAAVSRLEQRDEEGS